MPYPLNYLLHLVCSLSHNLPFLFFCLHTPITPGFINLGLTRKRETILNISTRENLLIKRILNKNKLNNNNLKRENLLPEIGSKDRWKGLEDNQTQKDKMGTVVDSSLLQAGVCEADPQQGPTLRAILVCCHCDSWCHGECELCGTPQSSVQTLESFHIPTTTNTINNMEGKGRTLSKWQGDPDSAAAGSYHPISELEELKKIVVFLEFMD